MAVADRRPSRAPFRRDVLTGLSESPKRISSKYLYDARGSRLFEQICTLPEYYLTRTELAIMEADAAEMAAEIGPDAVVIEYGSGSSLKTRLLLDALDDPAAYVPVDISREHLQESAASVAEDYPSLNVVPVCADFTERLELPPSVEEGGRRIVYFPGSTIGNFTPERSRRLLRNIRMVCGPRGGLLLGFDLQKDPAILQAAYDDAAGVTARFSLNLLHRINRELGANFDVAAFHHRATYNEEAGRIEIELVSQRRQTVTIAGREFDFDEGEPISTEFCHKYSLEGIGQLASDGGFDVSRVWTDERQWFGVGLLTITSDAK